METAFRLLIAAGILLLLAGAIFAFLSQWGYAALLWAGALGCLAAALNFKNRMTTGRKWKRNYRSCCRFWTAAGG